MPSNPSLIYRPSNNQNDVYARHVEQGREAVARSREMLASNPIPDVFAGRKTHGPIPKEGGPRIDARPPGEKELCLKPNVI